MGSILSRMYDDMDDYTSLCAKYGEKEQEVYSNHYYWLRDKASGKTRLSFARYDRNMKLRKLVGERKLLIAKSKEAEKQIRKLKKDNGK